jgi:hypothetical protein
MGGSELSSIKGKKPMKKLSERTMTAQEKLIPLLAEEAAKKARAKTLASGRNVVEAVNGKLIESRPDGTHRVLKSIPAPIPVAPGQKRVRRVK